MEKGVVAVGDAALNERALAEITLMVDPSNYGQWQKQRVQRAKFGEQKSNGCQQQRVKRKQRRRRRLKYSAKRTEKENDN